MRVPTATASPSDPRCGRAESSTGCTHTSRDPGSLPRHGEHQPFFASRHQGDPVTPTAPKPLTPLHGAERPVYAVAGGNHVTLLLHRDDTDAALDVIDVLAQP